VFVLLGRVTLSGGVEDLKLLGKVPAFAQNLSHGLSTRASMQSRHQAGRLRYRVVVQARDTTWRQYRRVEMQTAAESAIARSHPTWRLSPDAPVEIWMQQADHELVIGLRLTTPVSRQRGGRVIERTAALRPSIAAALVYLSEPEADDVFLDPMCGSGTILLERAAVGRYRMLLGGDVDGAAVAATTANFGRAHQPRRIEQWDATALPLADRSVDKLVCNLPWGRQVGDREVLPDLYRKILKEGARVLVPGGRMVLLTSESKVLHRAGEGVSGLTSISTLLGVDVLGTKTEVSVYERSTRTRG